MSKDKYPSIFSPQMKTIVLIILQIFYATRAVLKNWGIFSDIPQFYLEDIRSRDVLGPITRNRNDFMDYNSSYYITYYSTCALTINVARF